MSSLILHVLVGLKEDVLNLWHRSKVVVASIEHIRRTEDLNLQIVR